MSLILAIESSCDEMAMAILKDTRTFLSSVVSSQIDIHAKYGGVVPEIASRKHIESVSVVLQETLEKAQVTMEQIDAIAITKGPGLVGSLHIGLQIAKTLAMTFEKPLIGVHHIVGHIYANMYVQDIEYPCLALVISGGHTELVLLEKPLVFRVIGTTLDDAVGEAYDKVARTIGLGYPGGPKIERIAREGDPNAIVFPKARIEGSPYDFSFSGLKSAVLNYINGCQMKGLEYNPADIAASFQKAAIDALVEKSMKAVDEFDMYKFAIAGGVASNGALRQAMEEACAKRDMKFYYPSPIFCTDNAAMIGAAAYYEYLAGTRHGWDLNAVPNLKLGER